MEQGNTDSKHTLFNTGSLILNGSECNAVSGWVAWKGLKVKGLICSHAIQAFILCNDSHTVWLYWHTTVSDTKDDVFIMRSVRRKGDSKWKIVMDYSLCTMPLRHLQRKCTSTYLYVTNYFTYYRLKWNKHLYLDSWRVCVYISFGWKIFYFI